MKNPFKAVEAIERLTGGSFGMIIEELAAKDEKGKWVVKRPTRERKTLREMAALITDIYMISHAEGNCKGHPSWEGKKYEILKREEE
jgi:hypothetical protein